MVDIPFGHVHKKYRNEGNVDRYTAKTHQREFSSLFIVSFRQNSGKTISIWRQNALFSGFFHRSDSLAVSGCHHERMRRAFCACAYSCFPAFEEEFVDIHCCLKAKLPAFLVSIYLFLAYFLQKSSI